jgi:hypothetical protein
MIQNCNSCTMDKKSKNNLLRKNKACNMNNNTHWMLLKLTIIVMIFVYFFKDIKQFYKNI